MQSELHDSVGGMIDWCAGRLDDAGVYFGHGTEDPVDEAAALVFALAGLDHAEAALDPAAAYATPLAPAMQAEIRSLLQRRINERIPLPYLTHEAWFCGLSFFVDQRVLIPRSPFAQLIADRFEPWLTNPAPGRILELGTGSGCIAIALAIAFPDAEIVAVDIDEDALQVAHINVQRHDLADRVELARSDLFESVSGEFDLIVTNPPYVSDAETDALPLEYGHEPRIALASGADGLDSSRRILQDAAPHLAADGWLALEVGAGIEALEAACPRHRFVWPDLPTGGEGIALISRQDLVDTVD